jgi:hypothetical protein
MRSDYKGVWTALSSAKMHVSGSEDETMIETNGVGTSPFFLESIGISRSDLVLESACTECSTPEELQEYLKRAGFEAIESHSGAELISVWGRKPVAASP